MHVSNGYDNAHFEWLFDGLKANGAQWDIIGMSLYPSASNWQTYNAECFANMNDMVARYNTPVMVCEVGMPENEASTCESFITDLIHKVQGGEWRQGAWGDVLGAGELCAFSWLMGLAAFDPIRGSRRWR